METQELLNTLRSILIGTNTKNLDVGTALLKIMSSATMGQMMPGDAILNVLVQLKDLFVGVALNGHHLFASQTPLLISKHLKPTELTKFVTMETTLILMAVTNTTREKSGQFVHMFMTIMTFATLICVGTVLLMMRVKNATMATEETETAAITTAKERQASNAISLANALKLGDNQDN